MNSDTARQYGPWVIILGALAAVGYLLLPILASIVWSAVSLTVGAVVLGALIYTLPLGALLLRNLVWKARKEIIAAMPIETLETGLQAVWAGITQLETRIAQGDAELKGLSQLSTDDKELLGQDGVLAWENQLTEAQQISADLKGERDGQIANYRILERNIKRAKLQQRMGQGYQALLKTLTAGTDGQGASDMNTAMESIQRQMNEAQARVEMILSRPRAVRPQVTLQEIKPPALPPGPGTTVPGTAAPVDAYPIHNTRRKP